MAQYFIYRSARYRFIENGKGSRDGWVLAESTDDRNIAYWIPKKDIEYWV